jgi:hypothetical protein
MRYLRGTLRSPTHKDLLIDVSIPKIFPKVKQYFKNILQYDQPQRGDSKGQAALY